MTTIKNTGIDTRAGILAQQFARRTAQPSNPKSNSPAPANADQANPQSVIVEFVNKWKDAQQAIERMGNAAQDIAQSRKAAAAEMVRRIKEQLRIMMSMMAGMDPKSRARQIAQMARELAAAVREYAAASGGSAPENTAVTADSGAARNDNVASSDNVQSASGAAASNASETASTTDTANAESAATTPTAEATSTPQQTGEAIRDKLAEYSQNAGSPDAKADQEFVAEVKKLVAQLRALAKHNDVRSPKYPEKSTERETANTQEALKEIESNLATIEPANAAAAVSINVLVK
jgi:hypothetical protein